MKNERSVRSRPRAVVSLSGGMDSSVCLALAARDYDVYALHFSYGQRTEQRELISACEIGGSALTDLSIAVPEAPPTAKIGEDIPVTYVPFRNAHFLSAAVSWAEVLGAQAIFIGAVEQDSSGYPDCRPAYYDAFQKVIQTGTKDGNIQIDTPLIHMKKSEIVQLGVELNAPFHLTWSCYSGEDRACGVCDSCVLRLRAFAEAGLADPIPYVGA